MHDHNIVCNPPDVSYDSDRATGSTRFLGMKLTKDILSRLAKNDPKLTKLSFSYRELDDDDAKAIATALETNSSLTTLRLQSNKISSDGARAIAEVLKTNFRLELLNLWDAKIGANGAKAIAVALQMNSSLTALYLGNNIIGDDGVRAIAVALQNNSSLTTLDLGYNNIRDHSATAIATALEKNSSLTTLYLHGNNIGDDGAKTIATALKKNSSLTTLELRSNNIRDDGATALATALQTNSTLTTLTNLNLEFSVITEAIITSIDQKIGVNTRSYLALIESVNRKFPKNIRDNYPFILNLLLTNLREFAPKAQLAIIAISILNNKYLDVTFENMTTRSVVRFSVSTDNLRIDNQSVLERLRHCQIM